MALSINDKVVRFTESMEKLGVRVRMPSRGSGVGMAGSAKTGPPKTIPLNKGRVSPTKATNIHKVDTPNLSRKMNLNTPNINVPKANKTGLKPKFSSSTKSNNPYNKN